MEEGVNPSPGDFFLHYKGRFYQVTGTGWNTDSGEPSVYYMPCYEIPKDVPLPFNKTRRTFLEDAIVDGVNVGPRFRKTLPVRHATVCMLRKNGSTLFVDYTNSNHPIHQGLFSWPGGKIESGESLEDCVRREMREESCIETGALVYRGVVNFVNDRRTKQDGSSLDKNYRVHYFDCNDFNDDMARGEEGPLLWVENAMFPSLNTHASDKVIWDLLGKNRFFEATIAQVGMELDWHKVLKAEPLQLAC